MHIFESLEDQSIAINKNEVRRLVELHFNSVIIYLKKLKEFE